MSDLSVRGELSLDGSGWDATLRHAEEGADRLADQMEGLKDIIGSAFGVEAVRRMIDASLELGESVTRASNRLSISKQLVQEYGYAFKQAGVDANELEGMLDRLANKTETALGGGAGGAKVLASFDRLGVTMADLRNNSPEENFRKMAEHMHNTAGSARQTADMIAVFGRNGGQMIPVMKELNEQMAKGARFAINDAGIAELHQAQQERNTFMAALKGGAASTVAGVHFLASGLNPSDPRLWETLFFGRKGPGDEVGLDERVAAMATHRAEVMAGKAAAKNTAAGILSPEDQAKADADALKTAEQQDKLEELSHRRAFDKMTVEEKRADLSRQIKDLTESAPAIAASSPELANANLIKAAELGITLDSLDRVKGGRGRTETSSLLKTGNFLGTNIHQITAIGEETNRILRGIHGTLKQIHHGGGNGSFGLPGMARP